MHAFVFPGQGSQAVGMGKELAERSAQARAIFDQANAVLGFDLAALCFEGPEDQLTATENAQPAILTVSIAVLETLRAAEGAAGLRPRLVAGHSLGEYSALVAAGSLGFAEALRLVRRRGELMAASNEGTMAAVLGLELAPLAEICASVGEYGPCVVANQNAPGQLVISGATEAVQAAGERAKAAGAKRVMPLNVSAAFHSPLMQAAAAGLAEAVAATPVGDAAIPLIANTTAQPIQSAADIRRELVEQVTAPVRWIGSVETMVDHGVTAVVEIGAGAVLNGLVKRIAPALQRINIASADDIVAAIK
ncbi:MAG TPA: ACP S-malonyltransferase [Herpetosiphonaceae bacterium]|nr:ACP S-malonyltransferase [Herpetosiphonaceae bacterium]